MKVKDEVLRLLEAQRGIPLSGEALAQDLCVSRNAIWKAIKTLQEDGHDIQATPKRGYCLSRGSQALSSQGILQHAKDGFPLFPQVFGLVTSTNDILRQKAEEGAPEGTLVVAEQQSAGKGRFGRGFYSPSQGGVYMSMLLRPRFSAQEALSLTTCAAVAVCRAIEDLFQVPAEIKWVNDVFCGGKKVCGISTEAAMDLESGGLRYAILGIGVNLFPAPEPPPPELLPIIGTILPKAPPQALRCQLIARIWQAFFEEYPHLPLHHFFEAYRKRCFLLGQPVDVLRGQTRRPALALSLNPDFSLLVRYEDGREEAVSSGEVSLRPRMVLG